MTNVIKLLGPNFDQIKRAASRDALWWRDATPREQMQLLLVQWLRRARFFWCSRCSRLGTVNFLAASLASLFLCAAREMQPQREREREKERIREWPFQTQNIAYQKRKSTVRVCVCVCVFNLYIYLFTMQQSVYVLLLPLPRGYALKAATRGCMR